MSTDGLVLVDKPFGDTSHDVVDVVRALFGTRRVGHTGTLDPAATGLLVVCVGRATRLVRFLQEGDKVYEGSFALGVTTDTLDSMGKETGRKPCDVKAEAVIHAMHSLTGLVRQTPPMTSAVKVGGRKLYELARRGEAVERKERLVRVERFEMKSFDDGDFPSVDFEVSCGGGTYVRSLVADVGEGLGCGAYLTRLRRTKNGPYAVEQARTLDELRRMADEGRAREALLPLEEIELGMPQLRLGPEALRAVSFGQALSCLKYPEVAEAGCDGLFEVRDERKLVAIYRVDCGEPETIARAECVLAPAGEG